MVAEDIVDFNELSNEEGHPQGLEGLESWDLALKGRVGDPCQDPKTPVAGIRVGKSKLNPFPSLFV